MANPTLYKKVTAISAKNKTSSTLTADELTSAKSTITKFFELFLAKHT